MNSQAGWSRRTEFFVLLIITFVAQGLRIHKLGSLSLAEDEATKWQAVGQYRQGHFAGVNSEHPMLPKLLVWGSLAAGELWKRAHLWSIPEETWMRLPNIVLGTATTVVLYLLARQMLSPLGASFAAFFWAVSPVAVSLNRVVKEETPFAFFTLLAFYFYFRGKNATSDRQSASFFIFSGAAFGLDLASAYLAIGQFGLIVLIWDTANRVGIASRQMGPHLLRLLLAIGLVFVIFNPVILSPANLLAMTNYSAERTIQHHGYVMDGRLYLNNALTTPYGLPWYLYLWALAVKTPIPILVAVIGGIVLLFLEPNRLVSIYVRVILIFWVVPYSLAGSKWLRYLLLVLPPLYIGAGWAIEELCGRLRRLKLPLARTAGLVAAGLALVLWPLIDTLRWTPYSSLYLNALGGGRANTARFFPPDEVYDLGVRESVAYVCRVAPQGAVVAGSNPRGLEYYVSSMGCKNVRVVALFDPNYVPQKGDFLLVQDSRRYFETDDLIQAMRRRSLPEKQAYARGALVAEVHRY